MIKVITEKVFNGVHGMRKDGVSRIQGHDNILISESSIDDEQSFYRMVGCEMPHFCVTRVGLSSSSSLHTV